MSAVVVSIVSTETDHQGNQRDLKLSLTLNKYGLFRSILGIIK